MSDSDSSLELRDIDFDHDLMVFEGHDRLTFSPQSQAVVEGDVERLRSLLERGRSVNINDCEGNTPLHLAVIHEKRNVFDYLLTVDGVRLNAENFESYTPLMHAVKLRDGYYASKLLERNVEVNTYCPLQNTPLHFAVEANNEPMVEALLQHGAHVNCQNVHGLTPLHVACKRRRSLTHVLLYYGADAKIEDANHETAFYLAVTHCSSELEEIVYNYTYDNLSSETIDLKTLITVMKTDTALFYKLIRRNRVVYDSESFKLFNDNLYLMRPGTFKAFIERYDSIAEEFFNDYNPIDTFNYKYPGYGPLMPLFGMLYMLAETRFIQRIVDSTVRSKVIINRLRLVTKASATRFVLTLFSYGFEMSITIFCQVFWTYNGAELFSYLLHMEYTPVNSYTALLSHRPQFIIPILILDVHASIDLLYQIQNIKHDFFVMVRKLFKHPVTVRYERELKSGRGVHVSPVPSLLQLARDASRKFLVKRFEIKNNVQFFTMLKALPIPQIYKDMLSYRKSIYEIVEKEPEDEASTDSE